MSVSGILKALTFGLAASQAYASFTRNFFVDKQFNNSLTTSPETPCIKALPQVIYNSFDSSIIDETLARCPKFIDKKFSEYKLTPLHLATIAGNDYAMHALQKNKANLEATDSRGYTPLHHAALLGNEQGLKTLLGLGAKNSTRTPQGTTHADLLRFTAPFRDLEHLLNGMHFSTHTNEDHALDPACLDDKVKFVYENVVSPTNLIRFWEASDSLLDKTNLNQFQLRKVAAYKRF